MANFADETSLLNLLPRTYRESDLDGSLQAFFAALDGVWSTIVTDMEEFDTKILTPSTSMLSYYLDHRGNPFTFPLSTAQQRLLVDGLFKIYRLRGSEDGLVFTINYLLGLQCTIQYDFEYSWRLGVSRLGIDTILLSEPKPTAHLFIPGELTPEILTAVQAIADFMKPHWLDIMCIGGAIVMPNSVTAGTNYDASVLPVSGATSYTWSITNGVIVSGQGTTDIVFHATNPGTVVLHLDVDTWNGITTTSAKASVYAPLSGLSIVTDDYQLSGRIHATAHLNGNFNKVVWSGVNLDLEGTNGLADITFDVGLVDVPAYIRATVSDPTGGSLVLEKQVKIVPYTSDAELVSLTGLSVGNPTAAIVELGWGYQLRSVLTNYAAWVRVYNTAAMRTADSTRLITSDPVDTVEVIFEGVTTPGVSLVVGQGRPHEEAVAIGENGDTPQTKIAYLLISPLDPAHSDMTILFNRTEILAQPLR